MMQELFWAYGCNIIINSAMTFLTTCLLVSLAIVVFRIKEPRMRAVAFSIPLLKLVLDFFLYNFTDWALSQHINPLEAEPGSRILSVYLGFPPTAGIQLLTSEGNTFTLADLLTLSVNPLWIKIVVASVASVSAGMLLGWVYRFYRSLKAHRAIVASSVPCQRLIFNPSLNFNLQKARVEIVMSPKTHIPCALGLLKKCVIFPSALVSELSEAEYEAVVAHELDHLHRHDVVIRLVCSLLSVLFWWIPTKWCLARIERLQEYACDRKVLSLGVAAVDLAAAIVKAVRFAKNPSSPFLRTCFADKQSLVPRIQMLLEQPKTTIMPILRWGHTFFIVGSMGFILLGKFWIF